MTEREHSVLALLNTLITNNSVPGRIWTNQRVVHEQARYGPFIGEAFANFVTAFPHCEMLDWLRTHHHFYIRRHLYTSTRTQKKTVQIIASGQEQPRAIRGDSGLIRFLRERTWLARATCSEGEITQVEVNKWAMGSEIEQVSAKQCGFGSMVLYLCFLNIEHTTHDSGYQIDDDPNIQVGNMPALRNGLMRDFCTRWIYVNYHLRRYTPDGAGADVLDIGPDENKGNKAFIYAATASNYHRMFTFNPNPCREGCCQFRRQRLQQLHLGPDNPNLIPSVTNNPHGKTFWVPDILTDFNKPYPHVVASKNPDGSQNDPPFQRTDDFARHHGQHWYFCVENLGEVLVYL